MEELARVVLALLVLALIINLAQHGAAGPKDWLRAKFLGKAKAPAVAQ